MANTESYRQISDRFNITKSSVFRDLHAVVEWIVSISGLYIKWPGEENIRINQIRFEKMKNFPRVVGEIDGCHIRMNCPKSNKEAYYNRKKYFSILLQGTVDSDKKFIDVHCGEPGSIHDAPMFRRSNICNQICANPSLMVQGGILLGDSAYPDYDFLVTPYKDLGNLSAKQIKFNYMHSATRIVVENAFGLLKSRFRILRFFESPNIKFITNCVVAACVLHNICIDGDETDNEEQQHIFTTTRVDHSTQPSQGNRTKMDVYNELDSKNLLD